MLLAEEDAPLEMQPLPNDAVVMRRKPACRVATADDRPRLAAHLALQFHAIWAERFSEVLVVDLLLLQHRLSHVSVVNEQLYQGVLRLVHRNRLLVTLADNDVLHNHLRAVLRAPFVYHAYDRRVEDSLKDRPLQLRNRVHEDNRVVVGLLPAKVAA